MNNSVAIVIGAGSSIGGAMIEQWQKDSAIGQVIAISRNQTSSKAKILSSSVHNIQCDYSEASIFKACEMIKLLMEKNQLGTISRICICNGVLHNDSIWPEKRIEELNISSLLEVFTINSVVPILWLKSLIELVKSKNNCIITVFNARIGSIGDNRSGGWYSYRASKAALNMLLKTAAIEYARRAKNVKLISFHPGTTDTELTKPFQGSVKKEKLFTPEFVAEHLVKIMNQQDIDGKLSFIDWENKAIVW
ncbi:SDR family NAD(P)-dependent oxidoreductase [Candidatus Thioglobus sp.]|nr:SDR family NAD(P)-dependent oxidoreductase [Candidatus Thioglobus sp.]